MKLGQALLLASLAATAHAAYFDGESPKASMYVQSCDHNLWDGGAKAGVILGFGTFLVAYLMVIVMIFFDIKKNGEAYDELIKQDLQHISDLNLNSKMPEFQKELAVRLSGKKEDTKGDNMLLDSAAALKADEFKKYM